MNAITVDGFTITEQYQRLLLDELKQDGIKTVKDLDFYLKDYWYTKDMSLESHLLLSRNPKKKNFALPFGERDMKK